MTSTIPSGVRRFRVTFAAIVMAVAITPIVASPADAADPATRRVSVASNERQANDVSGIGAVSADGRYVAFVSGASNLVPNDTNNRFDVFVRDRQRGVTERVSVSSNGQQGNSDSGGLGIPVSISANGRFVAFGSNASNLVPNDNNRFSDVFVHDRESGITERVSVASNGAEGDTGAQRPSLSADGRYVAFQATSSNLVAGDTNNTGDVFVHDRQTGTTERVSVASNGAQANSDSTSPSMSDDGRFVAFSSLASNLVSGDTNGEMDVFVHDRREGTTRRASVASNGRQANDMSHIPALSGDGKAVAFGSTASNLVSDGQGSGVFVHILASAKTERVASKASMPAISASGRFVGFSNFSGAFVLDRSTGTTEEVSVSSGGSQGNGDSHMAALSDDGRYAVFSSVASNLVAGDTNGVSDVFVRDRGETSRFADVSTDSTFYRDIEWLADQGITKGCNPPDNDRFCPNAAVPRKQMAAFIVRALGLTETSREGRFRDVPSDSLFAKDINRLATAGITKGCNPPDNDRFCPDRNVTRGQMAAFLRRAFEYPATSTDHFRDDNDSIFENDINAIAAFGVTKGCNPPDNSNFCPDSPVLRKQMAAFLRRGMP